MKNIAVIFGGKSAEHSISIITAFGALSNLSLKYKPIPIYINTAGEWLTGEHLLNSDSFVLEPTGKPCFFVPNDTNLHIKSLLKDKKINIDCALLCLHGGLYEGGAVQGVLDLAGVQYTSADVLGSSVCMDKIITKHLCLGMKIPVVPFVCGGKDAEDDLIREVEKKLEYPVIIKPARCGSSVGISRANDIAELKKAIEYAGQFDSKILVERALENFRELNIAVLRTGDKIRFSSIEEIIFDGELYTFDQKYSAQSTARRVVPAEIGLKAVDKIVKIANRLYSALDLKGVVRLDMLMIENQIYLNEINTIPGSFACYLWRKEGLNFAQLLNLAINDAIESQARRVCEPVVYNAQILDDLDKMTGKSKCSS